MMSIVTRARPRVSVGLPVHDGETYLAQAIEAAQNQTFEDWELLISDNASADRTREICMDYATKDPRIHYARTDRNIGAAPNFNRVWEMARGEYFRWAAHDDLVHPRYLERCIDVLDHEPGVVLCHSRVRVIGPAGDHLFDYARPLRTDSPNPSERFRDLLLVRNNCYEVFGLIRSRVLAETHLMPSYPAGDRVLLVELALRGRLHDVPEYLFYSREHGGRSVRRLRTQWERAPWFDPRWQGRITFPEWRTLTEYARALAASDLGPRQRMLCVLALLQWIRRHRKRMRKDVAVAAEQLVRRLGP